jgi:hypothetical protein
MWFQQKVWNMNMGARPFFFHWRNEKAKAARAAVVRG